MEMSLIAALFHKKELLQVLDYIDAHRDFIPKLNKEQRVKLLYYQGLCYANLKKYEQALHFFELCIKSNPPVSYSYQCRMLRGYIYTEANNLESAETEFGALLEDGYESARVYAAAAHIAYQLKKVSVAVRYLQKALRIDPDNINALNSMSYILADNNVKLSFALKYIEKVLKMYPNHPAYLDTYGYVLIKLRRFADARRILKYALTVSDHQDIKKHYEIANSDIREF